MGGFLGARGSPFPAGLGLGFRLGLLGLGAIATVLRGFGAVCDLVFIRQGKPLRLCAWVLGFTRGLEPQDQDSRSVESGSQMRGRRRAREGMGREDDLAAELSASGGPDV